MFKPIANPYIVGNPIKTQDMFYGREDDFEFIRRKLESGGKSYIIVLCGERRSGKTSILFQILSGRLGDNFVPILIDMQTMAGLKNEMEFFEKFAQETAKCLKSDSGVNSDIFSTSEDSSYKTFSGFLEDIHKAYPGKHILFLIDEYEIIEAKIEEGSLSENFIPYLAGILESEKLVSFIFTGSSRLEDRKVSIWHILFGKSLFRNVSFLTRPDTLRLITEPVEGQITYDAEVLNTIYRITSGQPFYTQVVCQNIVDYVNQQRKTHIQLEDLEVIVNEILDNPLPQMIYFWNSLSDDRKLVLSLLAEILETQDSYITAEEIIKESKRRKFGLELTLKAINTTLETLYHNKHVSKGQHGYNFQMDLFRRWIKRDHAIWRVMKEVSSLGQASSVVSQVYEPGAEKPAGGGAKKILMIVLPLLLVAVVAGWWLMQPGDDAQSEPIGQAGETEEMSASNDMDAQQQAETPPPPQETQQQEAEQQPEAQKKPLATEASEVKRPAERQRQTARNTQQEAQARRDAQAREDAVSARQAAQDARTKAQQAGADQNAADVFGQAQSRERQGDAALGSAQYESAISQYNDAARLYNQAVSGAAQALNDLRAQADQLKQQVSSAKSDASADYNNIPVFRQALKDEASADRQLESGNPQEAINSYRSALQSHEQARSEYAAKRLGITKAITAYLNAIEEESITKMRNNHANFNESLESDWQRLFDFANNIRVGRTIQSIKLQAEDAASATVEVDLLFDGADRNQSKNIWKMELNEQGSRWVISNISENR